MIRLFIHPALLFNKAFSATYAQRGKLTLKKVVIDHFFTNGVDKMLDSVLIKYKPPIFFEREAIQQYNISERLFNNTLLDMIRMACGQNGLYYWFRKRWHHLHYAKPDDSARLRKLKQARNNMAIIKP
ncbi:hypothetical protein [Mucilaginibacter sp. CSA2-8R]|uniref:hypothetical protein n=1 Tax=Mucilaginibacter sp. CSA2-8R TaxID=3141542 RepID=UPI00315D1D10